ncbi:MAG: MG2 domain-containing protein [Akkermansia sp.]|nr:MG2 domain-containing protein [Akkermansia sp.]
MKKKPLSRLVQAFAGAALLGASAQAERIDVSPDRQLIRIKFDEPIVSQTVVATAREARYSESFGKQLAPHDLGLDLFEVTGDPAHQPKVHWEDQNRLLIEVAKGTSVATEFRLAFKPGVTYLSGKELAQREFRFHAPGTRLETDRPQDGLPNLGIIVHPSSENTKEAIEFSPASPVEYTFVQQIEKRDGRYADGPKVPGKAQPVLFKHVGRCECGFTADEARTLTPDSVLPSGVLVMPEKTLPNNTRWKLVATPAKGSGLIGTTQHDDAFSELRTDVLDGIRQPEKEGEKPYYAAEVGFDATITEATAKQAFQDLEISIAGAKSVNAADGASKSVTTPQGTYTFTFDGFMENTAVANFRVANGEADDGKDITWSYKEPDAVKGFRMRVAAPAPALAEFTVKPGIAAKLGLPVTRAHVHRINLNPAWPAVDLAESRTGQAARLPYRGEHKLRLRSVGSCGITATAYHWDAETALQVDEAVVRCSNGSPDAMRKYILAVTTLQVRAGLLEKDDFRHAKENQQDAAARYKRNSKRLQEACAKAQKFQPQQLPSDESGFCDTAEHVLDLDALTGGNTKPGLYLIRLDIKPNPAVLAAAKAVGVSEEDLTLHTEFPVQVSDLQLAGVEEAGLLLVSDRQTGKPAGAGRAVVRDEDGKSLEFPVENGAACLNPKPADADLEPASMLVQVGEDYLLPDDGIGYFVISVFNDSKDDSADQDSGDNCHACVFCDHDLYRPGDAVHVRGIIRNRDRLNNTSLPKLKEVSLIIEKPNGEQWKKETLAVDAFGCVAYDFTLPEGEEDVTGSYGIMLKDGKETLDYCYIKSEVYRRDAFERTAKIEVERVAPKSAKLRITAQDLNGTPLSNAKIHYVLDTDMQVDGEKEVDAVLDAKGCYERTVSLSPKKDDAFNYHYLRVDDGTITNDREEVRNFSCNTAIYNADFRVVRDQGNLTLMSVAEDKVLPRDQKVHLVLKGKDVVERETLPTGFTMERRGEVIVWEGDITVPANSEFGCDLNLKARIDEYRKGKDRHALTDLSLTISGTDPAGHSFTDSMHIWESELETKDAAPDFSLTGGEDGRPLTLKSEAAGTAFAIVSSGSGNFRPLTVPVESGVHPVDLKLTPQETGRMNVLMVMPVKDKAGLFTLQAYNSWDLDVPNPQRKLQVKLDLPAEACRPGAQVKLGGSVTLPDGSLATAAVTFYAVDEGMLSVTGRYRLPNPELELSCSPTNMYLSHNRRYAMMGGRPATWNFVDLMNGVWTGECISRKEDRGWGPHIFGGQTRYGVRHSMKRAGRAVANGAVMLEGCAQEDDDSDCMMDAAPAPMALACVADDEEDEEDDGDDDGDDDGSSGPSAKPRLRTNFVPVAVWKASLPVDAQGRFETECTLPDTLTTYRVFAVAVDRGGNRFGGTEGKLQVNQPVMLTPGTPFFMSTGDKLVLPLTVTNNTDAEGTWKVKLDATSDTQEIRLAAHTTGTLKFDVEATQEGECALNWTATAKNGADAVQGTFPVRFPAPLLKEAHHLVLAQGAETMKPASLLAPELAGSTRGELEVALSANPLLHLAGCMDFVLDYPYGCTEQTATGLLPWLLYDRMAPVCPRMAETPAAKVHKLADDSIAKILKRQKRDGGLGYWEDSDGSSFWASAHTAFVLDIATACGYEVPKGKMDALRGYLRKQTQRKRYVEETDAATRFQVARVLRDDRAARRALAELVKEDEKAQEDASWHVSFWHPRSVLADLRLIADMEKNPAKRHEAFIDWLRSRGHDYRHTTTWQSAWTLIALHEYLRREPAANAPATVTTADGSTMTLGNGITALSLVQRGSKLGDCTAAYSCTEGTAYAVVRAKAQPDQTEYPGVVEKGLQVTRLYEKKDADGVWRPARDFNVGDVVRVTLTCAKPARDLEYFVLEDYLPSCMEALNPAIPSQCVGLERCDWSVWFDHKEYLADRVRGFCTKWGGRDLLNMRYYARVKRAGTSTAPPAQAQLMYEPQMYGLSPNCVIQSK